MVRGLSSVGRSNHNVCNRSQFRFSITAINEVGYLTFAGKWGESHSSLAGSSENGRMLKSDYWCYWFKKNKTVAVVHTKGKQG